MDNLNLNKALDNELQDAHDKLIKAASKEDTEEGDEQAGFMKKYSDKVSSERSVIKQALTITERAMNMVKDKEKKDE